MKSTLILALITMTGFVASAKPAALSCPGKSLLYKSCEMSAQQAAPGGMLPGVEANSFVFCVDMDNKSYILISDKPLRADMKSSKISMSTEEQSNDSGAILYVDMKKKVVVSTILEEDKGQLVVTSLDAKGNMLKGTGSTSSYDCETGPFFKNITP